MKLKASSECTPTSPGRFCTGWAIERIWVMAGSLGLRWRPQPLSLA